MGINAKLRRDINSHDFSTCFLLIQLVWVAIDLTSYNSLNIVDIKSHNPLNLVHIGLVFDAVATTPSVSPPTTDNFSIFV